MDRLRVLTLNIWNRQGPWDLRKELIRQGLHIEGADVVALQEVVRLGGPAPSCQAEELAAGLGYHVAYGPALLLTGAPDEGLTLGNAVLSRFPIVEVHRFTLPNPVNHETRGLLGAVIDTPAGLLPFFNTHLDWQLELCWARCQQVRFITDRIDEICRALRVPRERGEPLTRDVLPAVLTGDLNAEPESDEVRFLRGLHVLPGPEPGNPPRGVYYADCFGHCGEGPGATFARSNRYAAREREPDRRIDYIFVGKLDARLRGEPLRAWRCFTQPQGDIFASDHYGVAAEIQVGPRAREQL